MTMGAAAPAAPIRCWLVVLLALPGLACSTIVDEHTVEVLVSDPSQRLGKPPYEVSVFDRSMGSSPEWARKTMGATTDDSPPPRRRREAGTSSFACSCRPLQQGVQTPPENGDERQDSRPLAVPGHLTGGPA
jgi:hypothetical protein